MAKTGRVNTAGFSWRRPFGRLGHRVIYSNDNDTMTGLNPADGIPPRSEPSDTKIDCTFPFFSFSNLQ